MSKGLVVTALSNKIEWTTYKNDEGLLLITGKREDVTDSAVKAMFQHMQGQFRTHEKAKERGYFAYKIEGVGELRFIPEEKE